MKDTLQTQRQQFIPLGSCAEEIAHFIVDPTEPLNRHETFESAHRVSPLLDPSMVLFQVIFY